MTALTTYTEITNISKESYYSYTHLPAFIGRFKEKEKKQENNSWILKPINGSRSFGHVITNNLDCIVRHIETSPRLIQKYVTNPFLLDNKKIDLRYWVVVRSFSPLELYLHKYTYARIATNDYDDFETSLNDWSKQFGLKDRESLVYNKSPLKETLVEAFDAYEEDGYNKFEEKVKQIVKDVFRAAVLYKPEIHNKNSRAIYGIDIIPSATLKPYILEVTFMPELTDVCKIKEKYLSQISRCMFFGEDEEMHKLY